MEEQSSAHRIHESNDFFLPDDPRVGLLGKVWRKGSGKGRQGGDDGLQLHTSSQAVQGTAAPVLVLRGQLLVGAISGVDGERGGGLTFVVVVVVGSGQEQVA